MKSSIPGKMQFTLDRKLRQTDFHIDRDRTGEERYG